MWAIFCLYLCFATFNLKSTVHDIHKRLPDLLNDNNRSVLFERGLLARFDIEQISDTIDHPAFLQLLK